MNAQDFYKEQSVMTLVEGVCVRPGMYTSNGTLEEAAAFLNGFYSGMASHNISEGAAQESKRWSDFCQWASPQIGQNQSGWYGMFGALRAKYSEDNEAFAHLAKLCIQHREEFPML